MWSSEVPIITLRRVSHAFAMTAVLAGCVGGSALVAPFTRNAPDYSALPAEGMREIAREIEGQVVDANRSPELRNREGLIVDSEDIVQALRARAARVHLVNAFLDTGHGWERRDGRLWVIRSEAYKASGTSRTRDLDALMVNGENRNRWTVYEAIIDNSGLPSKALSAIEEIFFEARLELMGPGQKYESEDGETVAKE